MQTLAWRASSTGCFPGKAGSRDWCTRMTLPANSVRSSPVRRDGSKSPRQTRSSACMAPMVLRRFAEKAFATSGVMESGSSVLPGPQPIGMPCTPASCAHPSAGLSAQGLRTATSIAAEASSCMSCMSLRRGEDLPGPASIRVRAREIDMGSCDSTAGKGSESANSGSMDQALAEPSISMTAAPGARAVSSPTTMGSSLCSLSIFFTLSTFSGATTKIMPRPQLKVAAISVFSILPTTPSHRITAGSSQVSARRCAPRCSGSSSPRPWLRPPVATCTAPRRSPSRASAAVGLT
mmetsp:Transcript_52574/g.148091  ORF Transcript_52574/g.148091 Transcript_52574/m.148091 type:complete len:293 (+) Transcript_52574:351-1229(+)